MAGTPGYQSPDVIRAQESGGRFLDVDWKQNDVFSFGTLLAAIFTNGDPFPQFHRGKQINQGVLSGVRPRLPDDAPYWAREGALRCWQDQEDGFTGFQDCYSFFKSPTTQMMDDPRVRGRNTQSPLADEGYSPPNRFCNPPSPCSFYLLWTEKSPAGGDLSASINQDLV